MNKEKFKQAIIDRFKNTDSGSGNMTQRELILLHIANSIYQQETLKKIELSFPEKRKIVEAYRNYDRSCHCSHTSGEDPSYHYRNGIEWLLFRIKAK